MAQDESLELAAAMAEVGDDDVAFLRLLMEYHERYRAHALLSLSLQGDQSFGEAQTVDSLLAEYTSNLALLQRHRVLIQVGIKNLLLKE